MRILFVNYEYPPLGGGGGVVNGWLAEEFAKRHEVAVLTSRAFDLPAHEIVRGVEIFRSRTCFRRRQAAANLPSMATFVLSGPPAGRRLLESRRFDVINTHFAVPTGPVGARLARSSGIPNVLSVHGGDLYDPSKWTSPHRHRILRAVVRGVATSAAAVVGQSRNTNDNLRRYFCPDLEPELIPLGIPRPAAPREGRAALGLDPGSVVLITVGRLVARKRTDSLLRMLARLKRSDLRLIVVGSGPEEKALREEAARLGVGPQVIFTGFVPEQRKIDLLAAADVYVSTSQHEGFGLVFLEAMAQGLPIVCYDHGGQTDYLATGANGAVLPLNDFDGFVQAVSELAVTAPKRRAISERNRREVEQYFIENCAALYEALFARVAARSR